MSKLTSLCCCYYFLFITFFIATNFISNVNSQTPITDNNIDNNNIENSKNNVADVQKVANDFANNLKNSFPSLVDEISKIEFPKFKDPQQNAFSEKLLDSVRELVLSRNASLGTLTDSSGNKISAQKVGTFIISFLGNALLFVLQAILTPVILLVQGLLLLVKTLLIVVLWIVRALLSTILGSLGLPIFNQDLASLFQDVQGLLATILTQLDNVLDTLSLVSLAADENNQPLINRIRRQTTRPDASSVLHIPYDILSYPLKYMVEIILFPIRAMAWLIRGFLRAILSFL